MKLELTEMEQAFRTYVNENYYVNNDEMHKINHVDEVWENIVKLVNDITPYTYSRLILFLGVYGHDLFSNVRDRKIHHVLAANAIKHVAGIFFDLGSIDITIVKDMILNHRASSEYVDETKGSMPYIRLLRFADKGVPDFHKLLKRMSSDKGEDLDSLEKTRKHLIEKFGTDGYIWKNDPLYKVYYMKEYKEFQTALNVWLMNIYVKQRKKYKSVYTERSTQAKDYVDNIKSRGVTSVMIIPERATIQAELYFYQATQSKILLREDEHRNLIVTRNLNGGTGKVITESEFNIFFDNNVNKVYYTPDGGSRLLYDGPTPEHEVLTSTSSLDRLYTIGTDGKVYQNLNNRVTLKDVKDLCGKHNFKLDKLFYTMLIGKQTMEITGEQL